MKTIYLLIILSLISSSCTLKKVKKHHGATFLIKKQNQLLVNQSNKNDIISLLGYPSTKSMFDNDVWIYIERTSSNSTIKFFGKDKIIVNNVLLLEINNRGLLAKKNLYDLNKMNKLKFSQMTTGSDYKKKTFIYDFLSSMRKKINDPLGNRIGKK